jgi:hypothetical protein
VEMRLTGVIELYALAEKYAVDKLYNHSYIPAYTEIFKGMQVRRLLEIGIGYEHLMKPFVPRYVHGASLRMWQEYFTDAEIYACDIDEGTLINEGRIHSMVCDQSSVESLATMLRAYTDGMAKGFDVVIDDGSHQYPDQVLTGDYLIPWVVKGGVYAVEDTYEDKGAELAKRWGGELVIGKKRADDCLVVVRR